MNKLTALYRQHCKLNAKIVDFSGWAMPLHYGSQLHEHKEVRHSVGVFDVSHMAIVDVGGDSMQVFLRRLLANDVANIHDIPGKALYSAMLNSNGGVIDDLVVYRWQEGYRLVLNCGNAAKDLQWMREVAQDFSVTITPRGDLSLLALQGPQAVNILSQVFPQHAIALQQLPSFHSLLVDYIFFARTGYTGEDGFEIALAHDHAISLWQTLMQLKVQPCGLGARDTLRIEAGLNLYGHEMDDSVSPLEANMGWTIAWQPQDRRFIGRSSLEAQQAAGAVVNKLVGLVMEERGVLRAQQVVRTKVDDANSETAHHGIITSGTFSPALNKSIALARVPDSTGQTGWVELRNKLVEVRVVPPRFVRKGQSLIG